MEGESERPPAVSRMLLHLLLTAALDSFTHHKGQLNAPEGTIRAFIFVGRNWKKPSAAAPPPLHALCKTGARSSHCAAFSDTAALFLPVGPDRETNVNEALDI